MSLSFLIFVVYVLGMLTGSSVFGLLRSWTQGAMQKLALSCFFNLKGWL